MDGQKSFWSSFSGVSTGLAALVTTVTTVYMTFIRDQSAPKAAEQVVQRHIADPLPSPAPADVKPSGGLSSPPSDKEVALAPHKPDAGTIRAITSEQGSLIGEQAKTKSAPPPAEPPANRVTDYPNRPESSIPTKIQVPDSAGGPRDPDPSAKGRPPERLARPTPPAKPPRDHPADKTTRSEPAKPPVDAKRDLRGASAQDQKPVPRGKPQEKVTEKSTRPVTPVVPAGVAKSEAIEGEHWLSQAPKVLQEGRLTLSARCGQASRPIARADVSIQEAGKKPIFAAERLQGSAVDFTCGNQKYEMRIVELDLKRDRVRVRIARAG